MTPGEYTQLTGRAGRRGIDVEGHAVVLWQPGLRPAHSSPGSPRPAPTRCGRASGPRTTWRSTWSARSAASRPARCWRARSRSSRPTASVVGLARQVSRNLEALDGYRESMTCHLGDAAGVRPAAGRAQAPRERPGPRRARRTRRAEAAALAGAAQARRRHPRADRPPLRAGRRGRPRGRQRRRGAPAGASPRTAGPAGCRSADFPSAVEPLGRVRVPRDFNPRSAAGPPRPRRLAARSSTVARPAGAGAAARRRPTTSELAGAARRRCAATRCTAATTARRTCAGPSAGPGCARETDALERRVEGKTHSIARTFDRVCAGARRRWATSTATQVTDGRAAARPGLQRVRPARRRVPARRAVGRADARPSSPRSSPRWSTRPGAPTTSSPPVPAGAGAGARCTEMGRLWARLAQAESRPAAVRSCASPTPASPGRPGAGRPARGSSRCSTTTPEMTAGDFVRCCKQLVDLLGQVGRRRGDGAGRRCAGPPAQAIDAVRRGVVAYSLTA